jgi:hypothetical protein
VWEPITSSKECYSMKLELLTNATVVDDAIRFVSNRSKDRQESSDNGDEVNKETNKSDYDNNEELEEKQEEETGEITVATTITKSLLRRNYKS